MRPTLRQLQYIIAVSETGRFHEAARMMNVSQPSLSAQIAEAELHLGVQLIERNRSGAILTPVGEEVVRRARIVLLGVEDIKTVARGSIKKLSGRFRLGTLPTIGPYLLPSAAKELHRRFPNLLLSVREEGSVSLDEKLKDGRLDMLISTANDHVNSASMHLFDEKLFVCAANEHVLSSQTGPVGLDELRGHEILSLGNGYRLSGIVQDLARIAEAHISTEYEGTSLDAVRQMAVMGAGVAVLPSLYALVEARRDPSQVVRPIGYNDAKREVSLIWRRDSPLATNMETIGGVLQEVASKILSGEDGLSQKRVS
ncbi:LysR family transcriptional regulator [Litorimonas taeanensis]|uniref:LysR family transcriptional regulator n=1 Tax=Litorimonas taeanensis TaxID=568099 RepID=A0A420WL00_9PROT|nr:hydrogen peroxide-inducible genes activator [Litorimonas taeanensis]RKQ71698.1 LysR family transcriptional regulator [Litorimonas taeanensis]